MGLIDAIIQSMNNARDSGVGQRLGQHVDAANASMQYAHNNPSLGSIGGAFKDTVLGTLLGLPLQALGTAGEGLAGEAAVIGAANQLAHTRQPDGSYPDTTANQAAQQLTADPQALLHPLRAYELATHSPDQGTSLLTGALGLAANPANYAGSIGEFGRGLEAGAPLAGRTIAGLGQALSGLNEAAGAPIGLLTRGGRARLAGILDHLAAPGQQAAPALTTELPRLAQQYAGTGDRLAEAAARDNAIAQTGLDPSTAFGSRALPNGYKNPAAPALPDAPTPLDLPSIIAGRADYNQAAKASGLPALRYLKPEPSALTVPQDFSIVRAARELNAQTPTPSPLNAALQTALPDLPPRAETGVATASLADQLQALRTKLAPTASDRATAYLAGRTPTRLLPPEAVTPAEEAAAARFDYPADTPLPQTAAPDFPAHTGDRAGILRGLDAPELDTLLNVAYGHEDAIANAIAKYTDPADLAEAALARITGSSAKAGLLTQAAPDLARQLAFLPESVPAVDSTIADVASGTVDDLRQLILGERDRVGTVYPPNDPQFYQSRANIDPAQLPGLLDQLVQEGTLGRDPVQGLMVRPGATAAAASKAPWEMTLAEYDAHFPTAAARQVARSHGQVVQQALDAGETVPPDILAQYPGMVARAGRDVPAASEIISNAQYRDRARQQITDARGQDVAAAYDQTLANAPRTYSDEPTLAGYLANEEARLQALQERAAREPDNTALQSEIETSRFYVERLRRDVGGTTPTTDLPALSGAQDTPPAAPDVIARGKQAISDLFDEAPASTGGTPSLIEAAAPAATTAPVETVAFTKEGTSNKIKEFQARQTVGGEWSSDAPQLLIQQTSQGAKTYNVVNRWITSGGGYQTETLGRDLPKANAKALAERLLSSGDVLNLGMGPHSIREGVNPDDVRAFIQTGERTTPSATPSALDQIKGSIKNPGLLGFPGGLPSPGVTRALIGGGIGGLGGGATGLAGGLIAGDNPDQLKQDTATAALAGVGVGAATGAGLPQLQHATQAALTAIATHAPALLDDTIASPEIQRIAIARGLANQAAAKGVKGAKLADILPALDNLWRGITTQTVKNPIQDAGTIRLLVNQFGPEFGTDQAAVRSTLGELARNLDNPDPVAQAGGLGQTLAAIGQQKLLIPTSATDTTRGLHNLLGVDMVSNTTNKGTQLNAPQRVAAGMGIGLANAVTRISPLSLVAGGARAYFAPFADRYFGTLNGLQHDAPRVAFLQGALDRDLPRLATDFLGDLAAQGVGVKPLEALGGKFDSATLAAEIKRAGGGSQLAAQAAADWDTLTETLVRGRADRIAHLFGDFRDSANGTAVKGIGRVYPFSTWAIKYAPVLAEMMAKHPRVSAGIVGALVADAAQAKQDGRPAWQVGTIPLSTETALVGPLVRARLGGQSGTLRLNPLSMISPYGGQTVSSVGDTSLDSAETPYEHAMNYANVVGLSPHPLLQAAAYASGQDYKGPNSLSRTAGLEQLPQALPSVFGHNAVTDALATTMPSAQNTLDAARKLISGQASTATDPVARRYGELVLATTGKTLVDPANRAYLDPSNPAAAKLRDQATREAVLSGAASNAYSLTSPMSATAQSTEAEAAAKVRGVVTQLQNSAVHQTPLEAAATQEAILRYQDQHPGALVYQGATKAGLAELRLADWERQNTVLRSIPTLYNYQKQIVMEQLGLVPPGTYASMVRNYELQQRMPGQFRPSYLPGVPMQPQQPLPWGQGGANTGAAQLGH